MRWQNRPESENVEDRRSQGGGTRLALGGGSALLIILLALIFGIDPRQIVQLIGQNPGGPGAQQVERPLDPEEEKQAAFSKVIFHDTEVVWEEQFQRLGRTYRKPVLVLFSDSVQSACGMADAAVGPFYCPADSRVYIDLSFYRDMQRKLRAPGEFARAYVIAHEVGHHVQRLLGYAARVDEARRSSSKAEANRMSVRLELQADYLAGVWAHHGQKKFNFLEEGDVDSALNAAFQIGDDRLQRQAQGYVVPDSFTHGTSKQRRHWFLQGLKTGDVRGAGELFELRYDEL